MTNETRIAVVNQTDLDDQDVMDGVAALQKQVSEDFGPAWQVEAQLVAVPRKDRRTSMPDHWGLVLLDETRGWAGEDDPADPVEAARSAAPLPFVDDPIIAHDTDDEEEMPPDAREPIDPAGLLAALREEMGGYLQILHD